MRALWSGRLQFSLFDFPIKIYSATQSDDIEFNQLHAPCGSKIKYEKKCPVHGPVLEGEIVKGYEYDTGKYVTVSEAELESLAPKSDRALELLMFVEPAALDPLVFNTPYYMAPDGPIAAEAYATLRESIRLSGKYGIGKMIMRRKEYLIALWSKEDAIVVSTLRYGNEVRTTEVLEGLNGFVKKNKQDVEMATQLIAQHTKKLRYKSFKDGFRESLMALIKQKVDKSKAAEQQPADDQLVTAPPAVSEQSAPKVKRGMAKAQPPARQRRKTGTTGD